MIKMVDEDCVRKSIKSIIFDEFSNIFGNYKFKIGQEVICLNNIENSRGDIFYIKDKVGVVKIRENGDYGVEFYEEVNGHQLLDKNSDCNAEPNRGLWIKEQNLKLYNKEEKTMTKILLARKNNDVILPSKESENAGYDIYAYFAEDSLQFKPHETKLIPTGIYSCVDTEYVLVAKERGSTGSIGMKCGAGIIDSSYRGEIFISITNDNDKDLIISKDVNKTLKFDSSIIYPYSKAIAQLLLIPVPEAEVVEIPLEELKVIPSKRGEGKLGDSGK